MRRSVLLCALVLAACWVLAPAALAQCPNGYCLAPTKSAPTVAVAAPVAPTPYVVRVDAWATRYYLAAPVTYAAPLAACPSCAAVTYRVIYRRPMLRFFRVR